MCDFISPGETVPNYLSESPISSGINQRGLG